MQQSNFFHNSKWVGAKERTPETFSILRGKFFVNDAKNVSLNILGMGFFKCFINGQCINPDTFMPISSEYDDHNQPKGEVLSGHRVYVPQFDITQYVNPGENVIAVHFGGGWYIHSYLKPKLPKVIYSIAVTEDTGVKYFGSDEQCRIGKSFVSEYNLVDTEVHNYAEFIDCCEADFDDSAWDMAVPTEGIDTDYNVSDCPYDKLIAELPVTQVGVSEKGTVYDCGRNTTGYPVLEINAAEGDEVCVRFSEEILADGTLDESHMHCQNFRVISDGTKRLVQPEFTWFAFRYLELTGDAEIKCVKEIYSDVPISSTFDCDNETLNWTYKTFMHTMHTNMHIGHPMDCPHIERRGYTGDGQVTCHAALSVFDAKAFYEKWLQDIADGQDLISGHIQYTAPYYPCWGGPGGWGSAIVEVPYQMYRHFGDVKYLEKYYHNMRRYIDFMEEHSQFGLVTSDKEGECCLGDWCGPNVLYPDRDITFFDQQVFLPAAYVNTYFMTKSLVRMCDIARIIGKEEDIAEYEEKIKVRKSAIEGAYFNKFDGNFIINVQGANAFAVDLGLGNEKTYPHMVDYYQKLGCFDTGIFATDLVIRTLFEHGDGELAADILMSDGEQGFEHWRKGGATTFHEYWDSNRSRSHNHQMFGSVTAYIFEYLVGIKQKENTAGYKSLVIEPTAVSRFGRLSGSMTVVNGVVSVSYIKQNGKIEFNIVIPENTEAVFRFNGGEYELKNGENVFTFDCEE